MPSGTPNSGERAKTERVSPPFSLIQGLLIHFMAKAGMATTDIANALGVHRSYVIRSTEVVFEPTNEREQALLVLAADYLPKFQNLGLKGLLSGTNIATTLAGGEREKLGSLEERRAAKAKAAAENPEKAKGSRKPKATPALSAEPVSTEAGVAEAKPKGKRGGAKAPAAEPTAAPAPEVPAADPPARGRRRGGASTPVPEAAQAPAATAADPEAGMSALERRKARKAAQDAEKAAQAAAQPAAEPAPEPTAAQSALERRRARKQAVPA